MSKSKIPLFKCRASGGGSIMTNPTGKSNMQLFIDAKAKLIDLEAKLEAFVSKECKSALKTKNELIPNQKSLIDELFKVKDKRELSKTCKQYLKEWIFKQKYGRRKEIGNKYTRKGNKTEQDGFQLIQDVLFKGRMLTKNKIQYEDDYFTGCPDIDVEDWIIDNKSSWNLFTFPMGETEVPEKDYDYQGKIYLRLANKQNFLLGYTLNDTPAEFIEDEIYRYKKDKGVISISDQEAYEVVKNHVFTRKGLKECQFIFGNIDTSDFIEIPKEKRFVRFIIERDLEAEKAMIQRVLDCREWVNENWDKY